MEIIAIIPARLGSSRFPGKPLKKIYGKPMIGHVYERVVKNKLLTKTIVATCDKEIFDYVESIGGEAIMTSNHHERASDRCCEALLKLEKDNHIKYDFVVMVQGDEPMIHQQMITEALTPLLKSNEIDVSNLMAKIQTDNEFFDKNCIKVVVDNQSNAIYFSREPIPTLSKVRNLIRNKQVCVIPFKRDFLIKYTEFPPTPLEEIESIDMLRVIENGFKVKMIPTNFITQAVDTPEDLIKVENLLKLDE